MRLPIVLNLTLFPSNSLAVSPKEDGQCGCHTLDWSCRPAVLVVLVSIYFPFLNSPLLFTSEYLNFILLHPLYYPVGRTSGRTLSPQSTIVTSPPVGKQDINVHSIFPSSHLQFALNILPSASRPPVKKMGNFCFRGESIRKIENEIEGLRSDIARLDRDRKALEVKTEGGGATASDQTTTTTKRAMAGHHGGLGGHGESHAIEELVPMRWRHGRRRGTGVGGGRSRRRAV